MTKPNPQYRMTVSINIELANRLHAYAEESRHSLRAVLEAALQAHLDAKAPKSRGVDR